MTTQDISVNTTISLRPTARPQTAELMALEAVSVHQVLGTLIRPLYEAGQLAGPVEFKVSDPHRSDGLLGDEHLDVAANASVLQPFRVVLDAKLAGAHSAEEDEAESSADAELPTPAPSNIRKLSLVQPSSTQ